ncbi:endonuclease Q family protein [Patescibacteria group bacterium]
MIVADLHLHSKYSRAVSPLMTIPNLAQWARIKGIDLLAAPDWTHPLFLKELKKDLIKVGEGIFAYKKDKDGPRFILATEISSIYTQGGKGRRIHNLILAPSFEAVDKINAALVARGANLVSDGRPIIGLSSHSLVDLIFNIDKSCLVIPCHIWTPWFSLFGSKSGFDSIKECFKEFASQIKAVETGLSSDPAMNWQVPELDQRSIVSFSDAHSLQKIGREVTVFEVEEIQKLRYEDIVKAIDEQKIAYTVEFYPEEGKYHFTGHRKCQVRHSSEETKKLGKICPACGRELTVGVMDRVCQLAGREINNRALVVKNDFTQVKTIGYQNRPPYVMMVPLQEIISETLKVGVSSKKVKNEYSQLTENIGSEMNILLRASFQEIAKISGKKMALAIKKVREGDLVIDPGFDGLFGKVTIWGEKKKRH